MLQAQIENYVEESPVCGFAKEIFLKMVKLGEKIGYFGRAIKIKQNNYCKKRLIVVI